MKSFKEFIKMDPPEQVIFVLQEGEEILDRIFLNFVVRLYRVDDFYVEIWYRQITNRIDRVKLVELEEVYHMYEPQIDISDIYR